MSFGMLMGSAICAVLAIVAWEIYGSLGPPPFPTREELLRAGIAGIISLIVACVFAVLALALFVEGVF